ncbi:hypothetical protein RchiOBHm_Chr5g0067061 [Rosa chinensis]|uniref:Uncharacterized protein n=1 Tax=Rosa chinensis TaxID=74649 RepID=A0A2P6QJC7_ROSCH|nr:hypothetical protein RchiOBHm_Chr5g0067061 [Rosa chinensis]
MLVFMNGLLESHLYILVVMINHVIPILTSITLYIQNVIVGIFLQIGQLVLVLG